MTENPKGQGAIGVLLWLSLLLAAWAYGQGLGGTFMVDDTDNLTNLSEVAASPSLDSVLRFALGGIAGPGGRPLSLASFAFQFASWPTAPGDFIAVNIALHLLNACLLFAALLRLLALAPAFKDSPRALIALAATWFWLFGAPQAGAVLYVIQRMAELAGTFQLAGLLLYLGGRRLEQSGGRIKGLLCMAGGVGLGAGLGTFAKESAALFPALLLCLEVTLLRSLPASRGLRIARHALLTVPSLALFAYLLHLMPALHASIPGRDFTLAERLLTEGRVLFSYLQKFLLPPLYGLRLYYDDYPISEALDGWTLAAMAGWLVLIAAAWRWRARFPVLVFALAWFLTAHAMESSVIPLEIAFDHRNYVALVGPSLALAWGMARLLVAAPLQGIRPLLIAAGALYAAYFAVAISQVARLWSDPPALAMYWVQQQPESRRAHHGAARFFLMRRQPVAAMSSYESALHRWPGDVSFFLEMLQAGCMYPDLAMPPLSRVPGIVARFDSTEPATIGDLDDLVANHELGVCTRYAPVELWSLVEMVFDTPRLAGQQQNHLLLESRVAALARDYPLARQRLDAALRIELDPVALGHAIGWSLDLGDLACADRYLAAFDRLRPRDRLAYQQPFDEYRARRQVTAAHAGFHLECEA